MTKINIQIVKLGEQRHDSCFHKLQRFKSEIFNLGIIKTHIPNSDFDWTYNLSTIKTELEKVFDQSNYDICIGFIDAGLSDNFFSDCVNNNNMFVVSFYEVEELIKTDNNDIFNYLLVNIYDCITQYKLNGIDISHDETKGCLFDMCGNKEDIIFSCDKPIICEICNEKISKYIDDEFIVKLKKELRKIRKPIYYKIADFIKKHPYFSLTLFALSTIVLNIVSSFIYDILKSICNF